MTLDMLWVDPEGLDRVHKVYLTHEGLPYLLIMEWAGPGRPPDAVVEEIRRRLLSQPEEEVQT